MAVRHCHASSKHFKLLNKNKAKAPAVLQVPMFMQDVAQPGTAVIWVKAKALCRLHQGSISGKPNLTWCTRTIMSSAWSSQERTAALFMTWQGAPAQPLQDVMSLMPALCESSAH